MTGDILLDLKRTATSPGHIGSPFAFFSFFISLSISAAETRTAAQR
jgi:hypothetical protein